MPPHGTNLGIMRPLGGGDPVPLKKPELIVGRRASCDICLDFDNVSGKHCTLRLIHGVWHVRDLGSTNGTTVNGSLINSDHSLMPDDELGIAGHLYNLDYEPSGPESVLKNRDIIDEDVREERRRHSLMELAGIDTDEDKPRRRTSRTGPVHEPIERPSADEAEFADALPEHIQDVPVPKIETSDEDFFKLIEESVTKPKG